MISFFLSFSGPLLPSAYHFGPTCPDFSLNRNTRPCLLLCTAIIIPSRHPRHRRRRQLRHIRHHHNPSCVTDAHRRYLLHRATTLTIPHHDAVQITRETTRRRYPRASFVLLLSIGSLLRGIGREGRPSLDRNQIRRTSGRKSQRSIRRGGFRRIRRPVKRASVILSPFERVQRIPKSCQSQRRSSTPDHGAREYKRTNHIILVNPKTRPAAPCHVLQVPRVNPTRTHTTLGTTVTAKLIAE